MCDLLIHMFKINVHFQTLQCRGEKESYFVYMLNAP